MIEEDKLSFLLDEKSPQGTEKAQAKPEDPILAELQAIRHILEVMTAKPKKKRNLENSENFEDYSQVLEIIEADQKAFNTTSDLINKIRSEYGDEDYLKPVLFGKILTHYFSEYKTAKIVGGVSKRGYKLKIVTL